MFRKYYTALSNNNFYIIRRFNLQNASNQGKDHNERQAQKQILQTHLGLSYQRSAALIRNHDYLQTIDNKKFEDSVKSLKKFGITTEDVYENPMVLTLHNNTIDHNIKYLLEAGFTHISAQILLKFRTVVRKPVTLLKAHSVIPENTDVPNRMYSYLLPHPPEFKLLQQFTDEKSVVYIHEMIFKHYLVWRLQTTIEEVERVFKIYDKFKYKSFDLISHMIKILSEELHFTNEKLLQNGYLFQNGPNFLRQILASFPTLAGDDIKTILYKFPKIIAVPPENISLIWKHLRSFDIPDEAIRKCFGIFTLAPDTVLYRLNELKKIPEFEVLSQNPRIVRLVLCQNKAKHRLQHLQKLKVKCASIHLLCASSLVFEKYTQEGNDRTKGSDMIHYICTELNIPDKVARQKLADNPHWCHVPLIAVQNTLNYLIDNQLPKSEIAHMPIILLYPKKQVRDALQEIDNNQDTSILELNPRERLNLCLYFIERKNHFSGDGVWDNTSLEAAVTSN